MKKSVLTDGIAHVAATIGKNDLAKKIKKLQKSRTIGIADICASVLATRTVNTEDQML